MLCAECAKSSGEEEGVRTPGEELKAGGVAGRGRWEKRRGREKKGGLKGKENEASSRVCLNADLPQEGA